MANWRIDERRRAIVSEIVAVGGKPKAPIVGGNAVERGHSSMRSVRSIAVAPVTTVVLAARPIPVAIPIASALIPPADNQAGKHDDRAPTHEIGPATPCCPTVRSGTTAITRVGRRRDGNREAKDQIRCE